jgi:peroxiredoxin Q/BCP
MAVSEMINVGDQAPDFSLPSQGGASVRLSDLLKDHVVVLYFYPKDESGGCTAEACSFRDSYDVFKQAGAEVVGVSDDTIASHDKFAAHHNLPFILLSDAGGKVRKLYGVPTTMGFIKGRVTFVIDREGIVRHIFNSQMKLNMHVSEALRIVEQLQTRPLSQ